MYNYTNNVQIKPFELKRKDGKIVTAEFYNNSDIENVKILDIKTLKFEGMKTKEKMCISMCARQWNFIKSKSVNGILIK